MWFTKNPGLNPDILQPDSEAGSQQSLGFLFLPGGTPDNECSVSLHYYSTLTLIFHVKPMSSASLSSSFCSETQEPLLPEVSKLSDVISRGILIQSNPQELCFLTRGGCVRLAQTKLG